MLGLDDQLRKRPPWRRVVRRRQPRQRAEIRHAHCHVRRKFSFLNLAVAQFGMSGRNPDRLLSYYLSLEVLPFGRRRLMLTTAQCQTYAAEYKSLARQTGVSEERTTLLKNIARSLKGVASQLDRLAVL